MINGLKYIQLCHGRWLLYGSHIQFILLDSSHKTLKVLNIYLFCVLIKIGIFLVAILDLFRRHSISYGGLEVVVVHESSKDVLLSEVCPTGRCCALIRQNNHMNRTVRNCTDRTRSSRGKAVPRSTQLCKLHKKSLSFSDHFAVIVLESNKHDVDAAQTGGAEKTHDTV